MFMCAFESLQDQQLLDLWQKSVLTYGHALHLQQTPSYEVCCILIDLTCGHLVLYMAYLSSPTSFKPAAPQGFTQCIKTGARLIGE